MAKKIFVIDCTGNAPTLADPSDPRDLSKAVNALRANGLYELAAKVEAAAKNESDAVPLAA